MQAKDAIKQVIEFSHLLIRMYVEDLSDQDLLVRSVPGTNHIAWQLGHAVAGTARRPTTRRVALSSAAATFPCAA